MFFNLDLVTLSLIPTGDFVHPFDLYQYKFDKKSVINICNSDNDAVWYYQPINFLTVSISPR